MRRDALILSLIACLAGSRPAEAQFRPQLPMLGEIQGRDLRGPVKLHDPVQYTGRTGLLKLLMGDKNTAVAKHVNEVAYLINESLQIDTPSETRGFVESVRLLRKGGPTALTVQGIGYLMESSIIQLDVALKKINRINEKLQATQDESIRKGLEALYVKELDAYHEACRIFGQLVAPYRKILDHLKHVLNSKEAKAERSQLNALALLQYWRSGDKNVELRARTVDDQFRSQYEKLGFKDWDDSLSAASLLAGRKQAFNSAFSELDTRFNFSEKFGSQNTAKFRENAPAAAMMMETAFLEGPAAMLMPEPKDPILEALNIGEISTIRKDHPLASDAEARNELRIQWAHLGQRVANVLPISIVARWLAARDQWFSDFFKKHDIADPTQLLDAISEIQKISDWNDTYGDGVLQAYYLGDSINRAGLLEYFEGLNVRGGPREAREYAVFEYLARRLDMRDLWNSLAAEVESRPEGEHTRLKEKVRELKQQIADNSLSPIDPRNRPGMLRSAVELLITAAVISQVINTYNPGCTDAKTCAPKHAEGQPKPAAQH